MSHENTLNNHAKCFCLACHVKVICFRLVCNPKHLIGVRSSFFFSPSV